MTMTLIQINPSWRFADAEWLYAMLLVPILIIVLMISAALSKRALRRFIDPQIRLRVGAMHGGLIGVIRTMLLLAAVALLVLGAARPQGEPEIQSIERSGRDICIVLDVSRSMLAEDVAPNRLQRAKMWISDGVGAAGADRLALVVFSGSSTVLSPLTRDHGYFRLALREAGPDSVVRGGTMIGDALRHVAREVFTLHSDARDGAAIAGADHRFRDVILITDGEDHGSFPVEAAAALGQAGIRLIILGIGTEDGSEVRIPLDGEAWEYLKDRTGELVITRLDSRTLAEMALETPGGKYFPVADGTIRFDAIYRELIRESEQNAPEFVEQLVYSERFQIFLLAALVLLLIEPLVFMRRGIR